MPEGDTVWRACRLLDDRLGGQRLTRTQFRVPALAATDLTTRLSSWTSLGTITNVGGSLTFIDTNALSNLRFYRVRQVP